MPRDFHISDVLSAVTGNLVSTRHMDGIYDILSFMVGESLFTHQLPRAADRCRPALLRQHPQLEAARAEAAEVNSDNWREWLDRWTARYGETLPVEPLAAGEYEKKDPISELVEMKGGPDRVAVVRA